MIAAQGFPLRRPVVLAILALAWTVATITSALLYFVAADPRTMGDLFRGLVLTGTDYAVWVLAFPLIARTTRQWSLKSPTWRAVGAHMALLVVVEAVHTTVMTPAMHAVGYLGNETLAASWLHIMAAEAVPGIFVYAGIVGVITAIDSAHEARQRETELVSARLEALLLQLQPHFILNTLNTVAVLIRESAAEDALGVVLDLGGLLQGMLSNVGQQEHALEDELAFIRRYLHVESVRFGDRLTTAIDADGDLADAAVPRYVLQPIVENALRHGIGRSEDGGRVAIRAWRDDGRLWLRVTDTGPGPTPGTSNGIGLANVQRRLGHLYGSGSVFTIDADPSGGTVATVGLPYRLYQESR